MKKIPQMNNNGQTPLWRKVFDYTAFGLLVLFALYSLLYKAPFDAEKFTKVFSDSQLHDTVVAKVSRHILNRKGANEFEVNYHYNGAEYTEYQSVPYLFINVGENCLILVSKENPSIIKLVYPPELKQYEAY